MEQQTADHAPGLPQVMPSTGTQCSLIVRWAPPKVTQSEIKTYEIRYKESRSRLEGQWLTLAMPNQNQGFRITDHLSHNTRYDVWVTGLFVNGDKTPPSEMARGISTSPDERGRGLAITPEANYEGPHTNYRAFDEKQGSEDYYSGTYLTPI